MLSKLIIGLIGIFWGGGLLYYWLLVKSGFNPVGLFVGGCLFAGGGYYLYQWWNARQGGSSP